MANKLIKLGDGDYVMASEIAGLSRQPYSDYIIVKERDGTQHHVVGGYGEQPWQALSRLTAEIDAALAGTDAGQHG